VRKIVTIFLIFSLLITKYSTGQLVNNGGVIMIQSGADVYITGGGTSFTNQSNGGSYGTVHSYGNIFLDGHWVNETQTLNSANATFNAGSGTVKFNGTSSCNLNSGGYAFFNLIIDNTAGVTLTTNSCRVDKAATLTNGIINTGSNVFSVEDYSTTSLSGFNTSNYINGNLSRRVTTGYASEEFASLLYTTSSTTTNTTKGSIINVTSTSNDPMINMQTVLSGFPYNPAVYKFVEVRYRVLSGTAGSMELFWCTAARPWADGGYRAVVGLISDGNWHNTIVDLHSFWTLTSDGSGNVPVIGFRYDWCTTDGVTMDIDYLKITGSPTDEYDFPVGTSSQYELAKIKINSSTGITHINSNFVAFNPPTIPYGNIQSGLSVNGTPITTILDYGYWNFYPNTGGTATSYDESLTSSGQTNGGSSADQHTVVKRADASSDWICSGTHDNATQSGTSTNPITAKRSSVNGFSHHAIGRSDLITLPVSLVSFKGKCEQNFILINWITSSETNNDYFEIEKSEDLYSWHLLTVVNGAGNSNELNYYQITDVFSEQTLYYRLKQVDYNGQYFYSDIIAVICNNTPSSPFYLQQTNFGINDNETELFLNLTKETYLMIELYNCLGQKLYHSNVHVFSGNQNILINYNPVAKGMYILVIHDKYYSQTYKIIRH